MSDGKTALPGSCKYPAWLAGIGLLTWLLTPYTGFSSLQGLSTPSA